MGFDSKTRTKCSNCINSNIQKEEKPRLNKVKSQQSLEKNNMQSSRSPGRYVPNSYIYLKDQVKNIQKYSLASTLPFNSKNRSKTIIHNENSKSYNEKKAKG